MKKTIYKKRGFLLFEFLLSITLSSVLVLIFYQTYKTVQKSTLFIINNSNFETQKNLFLYHIEMDTLSINIPDYVYNFYDLLAEKNKNNQKNNTDKNPKEEEPILKEYKKISVFLPSIISDENTTKISWISTRSIFSKNHFIRIEYIFKASSAEKNKKIYSVYRRESELNKDFSVKKEGKEYILLSSVINLETSFITPLIQRKKDIDKTSSNNNDKKEEVDLYQEWNKEPKYTYENNYNPTEEDPNKFYEAPVIPYSVVISGALLSEDKTKEEDFEFILNFPPAQYATARYSHSSPPKEEKKNNPIFKKIENKKEITHA